MKSLIIVFIISIITSHSYAQTKDEEAMALYKQAEQQYENKDYNKARSTIIRIHKLQGSWNTKVLYLTIKNYNEIRISFDKQFVSSSSASDKITAYRLYFSTSNILDSFFKIVDKSTYPPEKYEEILNIKLDVEPITEKLKEDVTKIYRYVKQNETRYIHDTIDFYGQLFVNNFNDYIKTNKKEFKKIIENKNVFPIQLEYNIINHSIKSYYNNNENQFYEFSLLSPLIHWYCKPIDANAFANVNKPFSFSDSSSALDYLKYVLPYCPSINGIKYYDKNGNWFDADDKRYIDKLISSMIKTGFYNFYNGDFEKLGFLNAKDKE